MNGGIVDTYSHSPGTIWINSALFFLSMVVFFTFQEPEIKAKT